MVRTTSYEERVKAACDANKRVDEIVRRVQASSYRVPFEPTLIRIKGRKYNMCYVNRAFFERIRYEDAPADAQPMRVLSFYTKLMDVLPPSKRVDWHNPLEPHNAPKINIDVYTLQMMALYDKAQFEYIEKDSNEFILCVTLIAPKDKKRAQQVHDQAAALTALAKKEIEENYRCVSAVLAGRAAHDTLPAGFTLTPSIVASLTGTAAIAILPEHMSMVERIKHEMMKFSLFANVKNWSDFSKQVVFKETYVLVADEGVGLDDSDSDIDAIELTAIEHIRPDYVTGAAYNAPAIAAHYHQLRAQNIALARERHLAMHHDDDASASADASSSSSTSSSIAD